MKPFTPRSWRKTTQAHALLEVKASGTHHRVLPPPGGNGENPGGLPKNSKKVNKRACMERFTIEGDDLLFTDLWRKPQTNGSHELILFFVADGSFTADGGLL